jgi:serine/threonine protein kinase
MPRLGETEIAFIFRQIPDALSYVHRQSFVHGDVKPPKILLFVDGVVKIGDLGVCQFFSRPRNLIGSPAYQEPEILYDHSKGDVWALGVSLYQSLFRKIPYEGMNLYEVVRSIGRNRFRWTPFPISSVSYPPRSEYRG